MRTFEIKQKFTLGAEKFDIKDDLGQLAYQVQGTFLTVPKSFDIFDPEGNLVSQITKRSWTWTSQFDVLFADGSSFFIKKLWTFWKPRYEIEGLGLRVQGDIWNMDFGLFDDKDRQVAQISKPYLTFTSISTYQVTIYDLSYQDLVISLAIVIDYVELLKRRAH